jgi:hypothetical protein
MWILAVALVTVVVVPFLFGARPEETYVDSKGVEWAIWYESMVGGRWHATDRSGAYGTKGWSVSSSEGTKEQAQLAAEWYAQNHERVK